jgi:tRNA(fMet)-specific endonuclease VapC
VFLLDTDHITILEDQVQPQFGRLRQRMAHHPATDFFFPVVSFHEQVVGAHAYLNRARTPNDLVDGYRILEKIRRFFAGTQVLQFEAADATTLTQLRTQRIRIGQMDLRIASMALTRQMTVLTRNLRDYRQVPGLNAEDWTV